MIRRKYAISETEDQLDYRIPSELRELLRRNSYSLVIKGSPGSGKTTLALTILRTLKHGQKFLYVSTRTSQIQVFLNHPWLSTFLNVSEDSRQRTSHTLRTERGVFVDARLDEQSTMFETITNELMEANAPMIVIDSWDAIGNFMDTEALLTNARVLQTWRERAGAKLIFINEGTEQRTFDFLVDGIALLRQSLVDGRRVREIVLSKLHGTQASRPSYFFTLNHGIFRSFEPYKPSDIAQYWGEEPTPAEIQSESDYQIHSRHAELDKVLGGGFPIRSVAWIKIDPRVNVKIPFLILERMVFDLARKESSIIYCPFEGNETDRLVRLYRSSSASSREHLEIIPSIEATVDLQKDKRGVGSSLQALAQSVLRLREGFPNKRLVAVLELDDPLSTLSSEKASFSKRQIINLLRAKVDLSIIVTRDPREDAYRGQIPAETHLEISDIRGTLFLRSVVPYSQFFAIILDPDRGTRLEPMA